MPLRSVSFDELVIDDEASFAHVSLYQRLKQVLARSGHRFCVPAAGTQASWDRALFLNLTFWGGSEGADVFTDEHVPADVVAHMAWHHLASMQMVRAVGAEPPSADALLFAESIASAFDLYLVGRLLRNAPESDFITTQVPIMSQAAEEAGLSEAAFASLMAAVSSDPERAFEDLRALLLDVTTALCACKGAEEAQLALERFSGHRFGPLLHHYQLSNWILYARAYANPAPRTTEAVRVLDATLRQSPDALAWLAENWISRH